MAFLFWWPCVMLLDVIPEVAYGNVMTDAPQIPDFRLVWPVQVYYIIIALTVKRLRCAQKYKRTSSEHPRMFLHRIFSFHFAQNPCWLEPQSGSIRAFQQDSFLTKISLYTISHLCYILSDVSLIGRKYAGTQTPECFDRAKTGCLGWVTDTKKRKKRALLE